MSSFTIPLNYNQLQRLTINLLSRTRVLMCPPFISSGRTEVRSSLPTVLLLLCAYSLPRKCVNFEATLWFPHAISCCGNVLSEPLSSNGRLCSASLTAELWRSGVMSHYVWPIRTKMKFALHQSRSPVRNIFETRCVVSDRSIRRVTCNLLACVSFMHFVKIIYKSVSE
jgi:hypothetical protein